MPTSKKRKRAGKAVKRQPVERPKLDLSKSWSLKIKPTQLKYLKDDPDFLTMVKFGRAINAISFAATVIAMSVKQLTHTDKRQYRRGLFVLAGYLHQTIQIIHGVGDRHITMESFIPLRTIAHDPKYEKARIYAKTIRNYTAFHLDEFDKHENTKRSLDMLDPTMYVLMGGDNDELGSYYFQLADYLDFQIVGKQFQGDKTPGDTIDEITDTVVSTSFEMLKALHDFVVSLARKMDLHEHLY